MDPQSRIPESLAVVGLVGGVASGKSLVAGQLAEMGAVLLDADRAGHEVLRLPEIEAAVRARWGDRVFGPDGHVDRARVAEIVFSPPPEGAVEREFLERLTHPRIAERLCDQARQAAKTGTKVAVLDAPLIFESGWDKLCTKIVYVDAPRLARLSRAIARGWTEEGFAAREAAQHPPDEKRRRADLVVDNSGSPQQTRVQLERFWSSLVG